jgi:hypothetical protein
MTNNIQKVGERAHTRLKEKVDLADANSSLCVVGQ